MSSSAPRLSCVQSYLCHQQPEAVSVSCGRGVSLAALGVSKSALLKHVVGSLSSVRHNHPNSTVRAVSAHGSMFPGILACSEGAGGRLGWPGGSSPQEACADCSAEVVPVRCSVSFTVHASLGHKCCSWTKRVKSRLGSSSRALTELRLLPRQA